MPRYSYECKGCGHELEISHSYKERLVNCPECKEDELIKLLNNPINLPHKKSLKRNKKTGILVEKAIEETRQEIKKDKKELRKRVK